MRVRGPQRALTRSSACERADVAVVKWPGDKQKDFNKSLYCIVTVFGTGL